MMDSQKVLGIPLQMENKIGHARIPLLLHVYPGKRLQCRNYIKRWLHTASTEEGLNTSTVTLRVIGGDEREVLNPRQ
jgi:hypothetical protein